MRKEVGGGDDFSPFLATKSWFVRRLSHGLGVVGSVNSWQSGFLF